MRLRISRWRLGWTVFLLAAAAARAEWSWNPLEWGQERPVEALIICGNIPVHRILAEVAQRETGVPILLVAPSRDGEQLFLLTSDGGALAETKANFIRLVRTVRAEHVVVLGDSAYLPLEQIELLLGEGTVVTMVGDDWQKNSHALAKFLNAGSVVRAYREALLKALLRDQGGPGVSAPLSPAPEIAPPAAPAPPLPATIPAVIPGEPVVPPRLAVPAAAK